MTGQTFQKGGQLMKRILLIGTALLLMALPLVGCGVAQEDLDDAIAERDAAEAQVSSLQGKVSAAESALTTAESDLAAAESALADAESDLAAAESAKASADSAKATAVSAKAAAESDLAAAEADIAALEAQIADLEAEVAALEAAAVEVVEEEVVVEEEEEEVVEEEEEVVEEEEEVVEEVAEVELTFEAATYTNEEDGFSVRYPAHWVAAEEISEEDAAAGLVFSAAASTAVPAVRVTVGDYEEGQTLAGIIIDITGDADATVEADYGEVTLPGGITAQAVWVAWIGMGYPLDSYIIGVVKDGKWYIVNVFTCFLLIAYDEASQGEIAQTIRFN